MRRDLEALGLDALLRRAAARWPDRPAMLHADGAWGWARLDAAVDAVVADWRRRGLVPGARVGFLCEKRPEVVVGLLACARAGTVYVPVNHKLPEEQVAASLRSLRVDALLVAREHAAMGARVAPSQVWDLEAWGALPAAPATPPARDPDAPCYLNLTSGSTGRPRAVATTQRQIVANAIVTADGLGVRGDDVFLGMFSVFAHPHELFHRSLLDGSAFVLVDSLHPRVIADAIRRWGVTWIMAVPSFYEMLLDHLVATGTTLPGLRVLEAGGAWVGPEAQRRLAEGLGATFLSVWGSTETTGVALAAVPGPRGEAPPPGCTGRALEGYHARVVREDGSPAPPGEVGELVVAGPAVGHGYVDHPDATAAQFHADGYRTRDLVRQDEAGWFWFAGRRDDMLKIGGVRVYPLAVEQVIAAHPEVRGVMVVRDEDRVRGEVARAVIETAPGAALDRRGVQAWCRARLPPYAVPRIVEFWRALPRLPNGKPDRRAVVSRVTDPARDERTP
ncbi:MAG: hypothetical protein RLZZ299_1276 [Pseudomonadota bacterium]|jgi:long-chain acyl-CoA synthetase